MFTKFLAAATTTLLALGLVTLVAAPASAHTGDLDVTATCNTSTGLYDVKATLTISQTGLAGSTWWRSGTTSFDGTPGSNAGMPNGPIASQGAGTITLTTFTLPGDTTTRGPWIYAFTTWTDTYSKGSDGQLLNALDGKCGDTTDSKKVDICHANSGVKGYTSNNVSVSSIITGPNGHNFHDGDIIPPFTYVQNGQTKSYPGKNWDAGGQVIWNNGCTPVTVTNPNAPTFGNATCVAPGQLGQGSVTMPAFKAGTAYRFTTNNGGSWTAGVAGTSYPVAVGLTVKVEASALPGYDMSTVSWSQLIASTPAAADHCVATVAPTFTDSVCTATPGSSSQAKYVIPATAGVVYKVNGNVVGAGTVNVNSFPSSITVTAVPAAGYAFAPGATAGWPTFTFQGPGDCRVLATASADFTASVCTGPGESTNPSFTLGADTNVVYTVTINGQVSSKNVPGTKYAVGKSDSVSVDAVPTAGHRFSPDQPFHKDITFVAKQCLVDAAVAAAAPTSTPTVCIADVAGGRTLATYTLKDAEHITWRISTDGVTYGPTAKAAGTYDIPEGTSVWVKAVADDGFQLVGQSVFGPFVSADLGDSCDHLATPATPDWNAAVCREHRPGHTPATYTVLFAQGVFYEVSTDGGSTWAPAVVGQVVKVAPGTEVWIQPFADDGYKLTDSSIIEHTFADPGACEKSIDYTEPDATDAMCIDGAQTPGSYTLYAEKHVTYYVRVNGVLTKDVAPGTYDVDPGDRVHVTAVADKGWNFGEEGDDIAKWSFHFVSDGLCTATPVMPEVTDQLCSVNPDGSGTYTNGSVDVPATVGVKYTLDGQDAAPGPHTVTPGDHTVAALALTGYKLSNAYDGPWTITSDKAPICGQLPTDPLVSAFVTAPTCAAPTAFVLGNDLGIAGAVTWTIGGKSAASGPHTVPAGTSVAVHAEATAPGYGFAFDQQKDWTVTAKDAASCGQLKTLALTGSPLPVAMIGAAGLLMVAGLSLVGVHLVRRRREQD